MKITLPSKVHQRLKDPNQRARVVRAVRVALAFLTPLPARFRDVAATEADVAAARYAFPVVGLALGLVLASLGMALGYGRTPPLLASFVLVAAWAAISGGRHLDGLADSCDGLFLPGIGVADADAERRLSAMREHHVGSFGLLAIVLVVLGKFAALANLSGRPRALALLGALTVSRTLILAASGLAPSARREGTARTIVEATTVIDSLWSIVGALIVGALLAGEVGLGASALALVTAWGLIHLATQRLGGITVEILGAIVETSELAYLVTLGLFAFS